MAEATADEDLTPEDDVEMTFFEHLIELRTRLVRALMGIVPGMALAWVFKERLFTWLTIPWRRAHSDTDITAEQLWIWMSHPLDGSIATDVEETSLHITNPMDMFMAYLIMAAIAGLVLGAPWVFWQVWGFISPGLYRREKRLAVPFVTASTVMFTAGVYFGYAMVLPLAYQTFLGFAGEIAPGMSVVDIVTVDEYLTLTSKLMIAFGLTFEVPVIVTFLSLAGMVNWRQLVKFARWWLLISVILAALLTPPDPGSQLMMAVPLNVLYWLSILIAMVLGPKAPKPGATTEDGFER